MDHPIRAADPRPARVLSPRLLLLLLVAAAVLTPAWFWEGGVLEEETIVFLRNHWGDRGLLAEVFDPRANDFGTYQARELSYFFDHLDAQVLRVLLRNGVDFFVPVSALVASALLVVVFLRGARATVPRLDPATTSLVLLIYLSNFVFVSTMGLFYRATKPLLAPALLALLFQLWLRRDRDAVDARSPWLVFGLCLFMSLLDRQGFFYTIVVTAGLALVWVFRRRGRFLVAAAASAAALGLLYNFLLGPRLVHAFNGYWPRLRYQRLAVAKLIDPRFYLQAGELLLSYLGTLLGNLPAVGLLVLALVAWALARRGRSLAVALLLLVLASQVAMFGLMIMRYPQVHDWSDHRLWYYPLPFQALVLFGLLLGAEGAPRGFVRAVALALITANVVGWRANREWMAEGPWFSKTYGQSRLFRASLHAGRPEGPLYGTYRDFYYEVRDLSPVFRAASRPDVRAGQGFYPTELRGGRVFAWARSPAVLHVDAQAPGPYRVEGELLLRPGDRVALEGATLEGPSAGEAPVPFKAVSDGPVLPLSARQPEREVGSAREPRRAAFGVFFPIRVRPASGPPDPAGSLP